ncbi:hypothetical protein EPA93_45375 [Ktedonosporobacter rubrisoli]|uniref:PLD phosphodiesterase domain-containing protein n=1 Tax=Ktedonosporobacter rubrisoli TaxID=2509675 RepID=A0A4P6K3T0_KTERU|nr:hypothetical protein [Ktedonosporobacter rubrisoli]QBD82814.1 hypothetical protein EPA93_45375 [Ktedonosporobacter rubrisoli]
MIFPTVSADTRPIAQALRKRVQEMEEGQPGLYVLAAREFRYPVQQQEVTIQVEQRRQMNLLEKFLLQAYTEIVPRPSLEELAGALGLDPLFLKNTLQDLISIQSMVHDVYGPRVTDEGKASLCSETIAEPTFDETRYFIQDVILDKKDTSPFRLRSVREDFEDLSQYVDQDIIKFPSLRFVDDELSTLLQEWGLDLHDPDNNRFVTRITPTASPEIGWRPLSIFILYDTLKENPDEAITFEVRSFENKLVPRVGAWLETQLQQRNLSLKTLCGLREEDTFVEEIAGSENRHMEEPAIEPEVEERLTKIRQQATNHMRMQRDGQTVEEAAGISMQLRDREIHKTFLGALQEAKELIIIYSPWMNKQVVDDEFIALLQTQVQKGVRILIGYGIGRNQSREDRPVPPDLLQRLHAVQTPEGTPGIIAEWLGNSHAKEVIVDRKVHLSGSHNWLSYRGDRFPRGEIVYKVTIAAQVEEAYHYLAQRFIEHAKNLWRSAPTKRKLALSILTTLGYEGQALGWIRRDSNYGFIPFWLRLALQGISSDRVEQIIGALQEALILCCTSIGQQDPLMKEIVAQFRKVFKCLAAKDRHLITVFIDENLAELEQLDLELYIRELNAVGAQESEEKRQELQSSHSRQGSTQRQDRDGNRPRRNR